MDTLGNQPAKDHLSRWLAILGLVVAALSFSISYLSFSFARTSHDEDRLSQLRDKQSAQMNRVVTLLSEYHSLGFLYFFEEIASRKPDYHGERSVRHAEYHRLESELVSELLTVPFFWRTCVRNRNEELQTYLGNYKWESIIQSGGTAEKMDDESNMTSVIGNDIFIQQYAYLLGKLSEAMAAELGGELTSKIYSSNLEDTANCQDIRVPVEIKPSKEHIRVNEIVTFSPKLLKDDSFNLFTTYKWWWDSEDKEWNEKELTVLFSKPGKKTVNLQVTFFHPPKHGEQLKAIGVAFKQLVISVE